MGRKIFSLLLVWVMVFQSSFALAEQDAKELAKTSQIRTSRSPITIKDYIAEITRDKKPSISISQLHKMEKYFRNAVQFMGDAEREEFQAAALFRQWLYLDIYRQLRLEYLLVNVVKVMPFLAGESPGGYLQKFDSLLPVTYFKNYPHLKERRSYLRQKLFETVSDPDAVKDSRNFYRGITESAYMSLALIAAKRDYLQKRYDSADERFEAEMQKLRRWESIVRHSSGLLNTSYFKKYVEPFHKQETAKTIAANEVATSRYLQDLRKFVEKKSAITDLAEFLKSGTMVRFGRDLANNLIIPEQKQFRSRIQTNFQWGVNEIFRNLQTTVKDYKRNFIDRNFAQAVVVSNTKTKLDNSEFHTWLVDVFQEQPLHWIIVEDYPFLQTAADDLINFVNLELRNRSLSDIVSVSLAIGLFSVAPLARVGNQYSSWLTKWSFRGLQAGLLAGKAYLVSDLGYKAYLHYANWQHARRLTRLNLEGSGLRTLLQEDAAYWSFITQSVFAGVTATLAVSNAHKFFRVPVTKQRFSSPIAKAASRTWQGDPVANGVYLRHMQKHFEKLRSGFVHAPLKQTGHHLRAIALDVSAMVSQYVVMFPAAFPIWARKLLASVPQQIYQGVTLGTVMSIMGVTVQTYITAWGLQSFVWTFDKLGFTPPAFWQQSTLNLVDRTQRDAMIKYDYELMWSKGEIARFVGHMTRWKQLLRNPDISMADKLALEAAIEASEESIQNHLRNHLVRWYLWFEFRTIANSNLKKHGYGLKVSPNMEEPYTMTMYIKIGELPPFSYTTTAAEIERVRDRVVNPGNPESEEDRKKIADRLFGNKTK